MKRRWIKLQDLNIYSDFHKQDGDSFIVDEARDGHDTEYHKKGIEYIKGVLASGSKIMPVLVLDRDDGAYQLLDGFKRARACVERGDKHIEAFICDFIEYNGALEFPLWGKKIRAWSGGLPKEDFKLFEGAEQEGTEYAGTTFLYKNDEKPHGLRIELSECIHVHWGEYGRYRLALGRKDFEALAKAVSSIK